MILSLEQINNISAGFNYRDWDNISNLRETARALYGRIYALEIELANEKRHRHSHYCTSQAVRV